MRFTPWTALNSQQEIADLPARGFQYRYLTQQNLYFYDIGGSAFSITVAVMGAPIGVPWIYTQTVKGEWQLSIKDPDGAVLFQHKVELSINIVAILMVFMGYVGVSLFTWFVSDEAVTEMQPPGVESIGVGYSDPAAGSDFTSSYGIIWTEWFSPVYMVALPAGAYVDIEFHNLGVPLPIEAENMKTRVLLAEGADAVRSPTQGTTWFADVHESRVRVQRGAELPTAAVYPMGHTSYQRPRLVLWPSHVLGMLLDDTAQQAVVYTQSDAEGDEGTWSDPIVIGPSGFAMRAACMAADGGGLLVFGDMDGTATMLHCTFGEQDGEAVASWTTAPALMDDGAQVSVEDAIHPMQESGGTLRMWPSDNSGAFRVLQSTDDGETWTEITNDS